MSKRLLWALILIALVVIVLILNTGDRVAINLWFSEPRMIASVAFFIFTGVGVVIGLLLR